MLAALRTAAFSAAVIAIAFTPNNALAQKKYDTGATDTEIKIGNIMPYSGPASAYGVIGKGDVAYFKMINDKGGINGRKITLISLDDGYSPPKAVELTRKLVEPIMPGRLVVEGKEDDKNHRFVDQTHAGSYVYAPDEFLNGGEFRMQIFDARSPGEIHKEVVFTADSKLIKQLRADFSVPQGGLITQTRDIEIGTTKR